jgi:hypothetical protein
LEAAAHAAGASYVFLVNWRNEDPDFNRKIHEAEAANIERTLSLVRVAAQSDWRAACWLLERRHPNLFSRPEIQMQLLQQINVNGAGGRSAFVAEVARPRGEYEHMRASGEWVESSPGRLVLKGAEDQGCVISPESESQRDIGQIDAEIEKQFAAMRAAQAQADLISRCTACTWRSRPCRATFGHWRRRLARSSSSVSRAR